MIRLSASCVAISLDPDVTVRTQAAYPRLLTRRTSTRLLFYLTPRRDCLVSHRSRRLRLQLLLVSVALILYVHYIRRMGVTHYVVLRSPDFPPLTSSMSRATTFYLPCLSKTDSFTALFANLSAPRFSPRGICFIETCLKADIRCRT